MSRSYKKFRGKKSTCWLQTKQYKKLPTWNKKSSAPNGNDGYQFILTTIAWAFHDQNKNSMETKWQQQRYKKRKQAKSLRIKRKSADSTHFLTTRPFSDSGAQSENGGGNEYRQNGNNHQHYCAFLRHGNISRKRFLYILIKLPKLLGGGCTWLDTRKSMKTILEIRVFLTVFSGRMF